VSFSWPPRRSAPIATGSRPCLCDLARTQLDTSTATATAVAGSRSAYGCCLNFRQPPARLFAPIWRSMVVSGRRGMELSG